MSRQAELAQLGRVFDSGPLSNRNLIINGEFQVSQRGDYTSATAIPTTGTYYLDRFRCRRDGVTGTFTHKLNQTLGNNDVANTLRLDVTSTATGRVEILQPIEDFNWFKNKTITFSAQVKSNSTDARLVFNADGGFDGTTASNSHTGGGDWELLTGTTTLSSNVTGVGFYAGIQSAGTGNVTGVTSGDYIEISQIQIEVGDTATPFEHRSYTQELLFCQRYYAEIYAWFTGATNGTDWQFSYQHPVEMRAIPSRSLKSGFQVDGGGSGTIVDHGKLNFSFRNGVNGRQWYGTFILNAEL